jgi:antirestriction protein ArdC
MKKNKVYDIVTNKIIESLESGEIPWNKPWYSGIPTNLISKKAYRGFNPFFLNLVASMEGYTSQYWLTYKQAQKKGGQVKKGESGTLVIFWKWVNKKDKESGEIIDSFPILRYYTVFNVEQCDGVEYPKNPELEFTPIESAEKIISGMPKKPEIKYNGIKAYYDKNCDSITIPEQKIFKTVEGYYATLFHELAHSTGHHSRLNRDLSGFFGSEKYSKEELIAELSSAMLCGIVGIQPEIIDNSTAYIQNWLKVLKSDSKFVISASASAQKACDFIQNITFESE